MGEGEGERGGGEGRGRGEGGGDHKRFGRLNTRTSYTMCSAHTTL